MPMMRKLGVRHIQAMLVSGALIVNHMQQANLGIALVVIKTEESAQQKDTIFHDHKYDTIVDNISTIRGVFFYSLMVFSIVGGYLTTKINCKNLLLFATLTEMIACYFTPLMVTNFGSEVFFFIRLVQGAAQGFVGPSVYNIAARWLPPAEMRIYGPAIFCGMYTGICIMMFVGGYLGTGRGGWQSIFYFCGNCALLWSIAFLGLGYASPDSCFYVSKLEREYINENVPPSLLNPYRYNIPWRKIFTCVPLLAPLLCQTANNWAIQVLINIRPIFFQQRLRYNLETTGLLCGIPFLLMCFVVYTLTVVFKSLWVRGKLSHTKVRHLCNAIGQFGAAYIFMFCACSERTRVNLALHILGVVFGALQLFGYQMNYYDLSPTYAGLLNGICSGIAHVGSIVGPQVTWKMFNEYEGDKRAWYHDRKYIGWRKTFDIISLNYFIGATAFMFLGEVKEQDFDKNETKRLRRQQMISN